MPRTQNAGTLRATAEIQDRVSDPLRQIDRQIAGLAGGGASSLLRFASIGGGALASVGAAALAAGQEYTEALDIIATGTGATGAALEGLGDDLGGRTRYVIHQRGGSGVCTRSTQYSDRRDGRGPDDCHGRCWQVRASLRSGRGRYREDHRSDSPAVQPRRGGHRARSRSGDCRIAAVWAWARPPCWNRYGNSGRCWKTQGSGWNKPYRCSAGWSPSVSTSRA